MDVPGYLQMSMQQNSDVFCVLTKHGYLEEHQLNDLSVITQGKIINTEMTKDMILYLMDASDGNKYDFMELCLGRTDVSELPENNNIKINTSLFNGIIGHAAESLLSRDNGSIFRVNGIAENERYIETLKYAEVELEQLRNKTEHERKNYSIKVSKANSRLSQLNMKNYMYYVGAESELQKRILHDAIEDVVKCCRSAVRHGVVPGCQLSVIRACDEIIEEIKNEYNGDVENLNVPIDAQLELVLLSIISNACIRVYKHILIGPEGVGILQTIEQWQDIAAGGNEAIERLKKRAADKCNQIIDESIQKNMAFDIDTLELNPNIITSVETDTQVLIASSELIKILISGNQCLIVDAMDENAHEEIVEAYV